MASRLTSGLEDDSNPSFSPDGARLAFSRTVGNDSDVYVVPVEGGRPDRLTFHPAAELVRGWSPDGSKILFTAARTLTWQPRLYTVPAAGGPSRELAIPIAWNGVFAPDGRVIYAPRDVVGRYSMSWRGYRGGSMAALALADLRAGTFVPLSSDQGNDRLPIWAGDRLLIASDRENGFYNIYSLDIGSRRANRITAFTSTGLGALAGGPDGAAAYERNGRIYLLDLSTGRTQPIAISLAADASELAERQVAAADYVDTASISPAGEVAISARGDIVLVDAARHAHNLTNSSAVTDQAPAFSFDGRRLAFVSFGAEGDILVVETLGVAGSRRMVPLPPGRGGYYAPLWSPDGRHVALTDIRAGLWLVDAVVGSARLIDAGKHMNDGSFEAVWSPDGQWLAYTRYLPNNNRALFLHNISGRGSAFQLTSGEADVGAPAFTRDGKQIYFTTSSNAGVAEAFGMYPALLRPLVLRRIQAASVDLAEPAASLRRSLSPEAFAQRVRSLRFEARDYSSLSSLTDGTLLASAKQWATTPGRGNSTLALFHLDPSSPDTKPIASNVDRFALSPDSARLLVNSGDGWSVRSLPAGKDSATFTLNGVRLKVVPAEEWRQIYREAWRAMRDSFYDPTHHGQDIAALEEQYAHYLPGITRRADLTALLYLALGNVSVSHIAFDGGDGGLQPIPRPAAGLLGADFTIESGRFRFARIYAGAPFAPESDTTSPLASANQPVTPGEYLLRVNDVEATPNRDLYSYFLGAAGRSTRVTVARTPDGRDARTVIVQPLASEAALREAAWVEDNRARVRARSNGTVAYVYIPNFQERGLAAFIRQWTAASDKDGVVIDQRYNPGGWGADFILDSVLHRPLAYYMVRGAQDLPFPVIGNAGPRALLANERNGSAADTFPWLFKHAGAGPVVGRRTAGWGVGNIWRTTFMDGGGLNLPLRAFFNPDGSWDIENRGVSPDIPVEMDPAAALRGEDPQLDAAVDAVLARRRQLPTPMPRHPPPLRYPAQIGH